MCTQLISFMPILKYMFFFAMEHQRLVQKKNFCLGYLQILPRLAF